MFNEIMNIFTECFGACTAWITELLDSTGTTALVISALIIYFAVALLLIPLRGRNTKSKE